MRNIVMRVAYDGTRYLGWQKISEALAKSTSIEGELERQLQKILQSPIQLQAASRTDRGVHAHGQVVNFLTEKPDIDLDRLHQSLRALLPSDICVLSVADAPNPAFHPTLDAKGKQYQYRIAYGKTLLPFHRFTHWHFFYPLDIEQMKLAAEVIKGTHDFAAFCNERREKNYTNTVRTVFDIEIRQHEEERLSILITGNNFLYKMARNIAGTLAYVGAGKMTIDQVASLFVDGTRASGAITAPACGLSLLHVHY
ncbi:MAG: tRNA pseudouridine(38-40) synthase TruA [Verrucomicrobia bacterium]|nr:tRNA pseudouridine(38-40) synthase TruA [Verrucomicrobiota bacterium]